MAYNTKSIIKDINGKPAPQLYNPVTDAYEVIQGQGGASKVMVYDVNGNIIDLTALLNGLLTAINNMSNKDSTTTFYGLSTDVKPTVGNMKGNKYFEINTGNVFMWNGSAWVVI